MEKIKEENAVYSQKETVLLTGLSADLLRTYENEFNLKIERTSGGHRRYLEKDIELFKTIKKKIQDQNWSYKQVRSWVNGEDLPEALQNAEVKSKLEKQVDLLVQEQIAMRQAFQDLTKKLDEKEQQNRLYLEKLIEEKDKNVTLEMRKLLESPEKQKKWYQIWK